MYLCDSSAKDRRYYFPPTIVIYTLLHIYTVHQLDVPIWTVVTARATAAKPPWATKLEISW